jgi:hypothetical protein
LFDIYPILKGLAPVDEHYWNFFAISGGELLVVQNVDFTEGKGVHALQLLQEVFGLCAQVAIRLTEHFYQRARGKGHCWGPFLHAYSREIALPFLCRL